MRSVLLFFLLCVCVPGHMIASETSETYITALARHFDIDQREVANLHRRGYGRSELITLIVISRAAGTALKEIVLRRDHRATITEICGAYRLSVDTILDAAREHRHAIDITLSRTDR